MMVKFSPLGDMELKVIFFQIFGISRAILAMWLASYPLS